MADLKSKLDIQNILGNIKTMISPTANTPNPDAKDVLGMKLAELSLLVQGVQTIYAEQGKQLAKINKLFNEVYHEIEVQRHTEKTAEKTTKTKSTSKAKKPEKK